MSARRKGSDRSPAKSQLDIEDSISDAVLVLSGHFVTTSTETAAALAEAGWQEGHRALCAKAEALTRAREPLPLDLQQYIVAVAARSTIPKRKKGNITPNFGRDICIKVAVERLCRRGFKPTRNPNSREESGCSIVKTALARLGVHNISEDAIQKVWDLKSREEREDLFE
jgi:hypothetical protein